jgi:hypothetical protein
MLDLNISVAIANYAFKGTWLLSTIFAVLLNSTSLQNWLHYTTLLNS